MSPFVALPRNEPLERPGQRAESSGGSRLFSGAKAPKEDSEMDESKTRSFGFGARPVRRGRAALEQLGAACRMTALATASAQAQEVAPAPAAPAPVVPAPVAPAPGEPPPVADAAPPA